MNLRSLLNRLRAPDRDRESLERYARARAAMRAVSRREIGTPKPRRTR